MNDEKLGHDIIAIGASAGGLEALKTLVKDLPHDLPATIFLVVHISPQSVSRLPKIISHHGTLPALHPVDGQIIERGHIYIAPPDHHLVVEDSHIRLTRGPAENRSRPAVDTLFRSVASHYGPRAIGVILSGYLDDGAAGLLSIKKKGGIAVVQDPSDAASPGMPYNAIENASVDYVLPISSMAPLLTKLVYQEPERQAEVEMEDEERDELEIVQSDIEDQKVGNRTGVPSTLTCPDCGGVVWEMEEDNLLRYRCHVGHTFNAETMVARQARDVEEAIWSAIRALEESAVLSKRVANRLRPRHPAVAEHYDHRAAAAERHSDLIRKVVFKDSEYTAELLEEEKEVEAENGDKLP